MRMQRATSVTLRARRAWLGLFLACIGIAGGSMSLAYPFGWDTGVHFYVGREWLLRGAVPYRDVFDHKTPGIHLIHAVCIYLFGEHMWGIRVAELATVVVLGVLSAALVAPRKERVPAGLYGAGIFLASVAYYGFFDYWNTAQCELFATTLGTASVVAATRLKRMGFAAALTGLIGGALFVVKPPYVALLLVPMAVLVARARAQSSGRGRRVAVSLALLSLTFAAVPVAFLVYFGAKGALSALADVVVGSNVSYFINEARVHSLSDVSAVAAVMYRYFAPLSTLLLAGAAVSMLVGVVRRSRERVGRYAVAFGLFAASLLVVVAQLKFYVYHWEITVGAVTLLGTNLTLDVARALGTRRGQWAAVLVPGAVAVAFVCTGCQFVTWRNSVTKTLAYVSGRIDRSEFNAHFTTWYGHRRYADLEAAGVWIRDHSSEDDRVLVRGIATEIYVVSGRRTQGRFFWTPFLTRPSRAYHRDEWLQEDYAVITQTPPRFVVADANVRGGPESVEWFLPLGYVERERIGPYAILELTAAPSRLLESRTHGDDASRADTIGAASAAQR
jgi:hypothetical protein